MSAIIYRKSVLGLLAAALIGMASAATAADPVRPALPPAPSAGPKAAYAKERPSFLTEEMRKAFPRLGEDFEIVGPADDKYNAFGHALGLSRWVNPEAGDANNPLAGIDRLFGKHGYQRQSEFDLSAQPGVEKVVLYVTVDVDGGVKDVTAAAHQEADGTWTMKVGQMHKIRLRDPFLMRGPTYGMPYVVYSR